MRYNKIWRAAILPLFIIAVMAAAVISYRTEENSCMGVRILTEAEMSRFTTHVPQEISGWIVCDGEPAAVDAGTFTVYISQNIGEKTSCKDLKGTLGTSHPDWEVYFAGDEMFGDLDTAVKNNHPFRMIVATGAAEYMEYSVVFTTLPVIRLAGERLYITPDREEQFGGEITLWDSNYAGTGGKLVEKSNAQWTDSDRRDSKEAKRSWKISLKNSNGGINMLNLFGQGKDDDWVMNSLYGDDSKVRENLAAQLWNAIASDKQYSLKTPAGEYAEVVCNGEYQGIYSVGRKTDQKYLDLDSDDLLLRDKKYPRGSYVQNNYTILEGYYTEAEVWDIAEPFHSKSDLSVLDADNWVDVNLFENIMYNKGRRSGAEMYYLYKNAGTSPVLEMMPVPEDALLGITWKEENAHFVYDGSFSTAEVKYREEYSLLKQLYPDLDERIAERYRYLRENIFDRDTIYALAEDEYGQLEESGALLRDSRRWNAAQENNGTESLKNHIKARLEYLDVYYGIK